MQSTNVEIPVEIDEKKVDDELDKVTKEIENETHPIKIDASVENIDVPEQNIDIPVGVDASSAENFVRNLENEMCSTNVEIPANFDHKKVNNELNKLEQKLQELSYAQQPLIDKAENLKMKIVEAKAEAERYGQMWRNGVTGADQEQMDWVSKVKLLEAEYNKVMLEIEKIDNKMLPIQDKMDKIKLDPASFAPAKESAEQTEQAVRKTADAASKVNKETNKVSTSTEKVEKNTRQTEKNVRKTTTASRSLASTGNNVAKAFEGFAKRIANVGLSVFIFTVLNKGLTKVREQLSSMLSTNAAFTSSMNAVKSNLSTAFQPIYEACLPAINALAGALATVTKYIAAFTSFLFGKSAAASQKSAQNMYALSNATKSTAQNTKKATKELSKEAKEAEKTFASFDEIQQLSTNSTDISIPDVDIPEEANAEAPVGAGMFETDFSDTEEFVKKLEKIKAVVDRIGDSFKKGWDLEASKADIEQLKTHIDGIKTSYNEIFSNIDVQNAAKTLVDKFAYNAGRNSGALHTLGVSYGNLIFGGIDKFLDENKDRISDKLVKLWGIAGKTSDIITDWNVAVSGILSGVFNDETSQDILSNLISIGFDATTGVEELCGNFGNDILGIITQPFVDNEDKIEEAIINTLGPIETVTDNVKKSVQEFSDKINECYTKYLSPVFGGIKDSWSDICGKFIDSYNKHMKPVFDQISERLAPFYDKYIAPLVSRLEPIFLAIATGLSGIWKNTLSPMLNFIAENFWPTVATIFDNAFTLIDKLSEKFGGFTEFLEGVFSGDVKKALEGLKVLFKDEINLIIGWIEKAVNGAVSAINKMICAVNAISAAVNIAPIPSISAITIPKLAKGAVIPPNKEFLAVLGDQRNGTNIETPLATMIDAFKAALSEGGYSSLPPICISFEGNLAQLGRVLNPVITVEGKRIGNSMSNITMGGVS